MIKIIAYIKSLNLKTVLLTSGFLLAGCIALGQPFWKSGILADEFIAAKMPFPESHAATIAETPEGRVVAWFGGTKERNPDVEIWMSKLNANGKWTAPISIANGIINEGLRFACWNPVLYQVPKGDLLLFYKVGPNVAEWKGWMKRSKDHGKTWSPAIALPADCLGPVKNKPVLLDNGILLAASSTEGSKGWNLHMEFSSDMGTTWVRGADLLTDKGIKAIQPSILKHADGRLQLLARTQQRALAEAWSSDNGKTWSTVSLSSMPNNNSGADAVTLSDGRQLLVYNHVVAHDSIKNGKGPRTPLNLAISKDGVKWSAALVLEDSPISQYSYPSIIQSSDGMVHVVYTWRREGIKYVKIDPSQLQTGLIVNGKWPLSPDALSAAVQHTADDQFRKPLVEVLNDIQSRFKVAIRYPAELVKDKQVNYAQWRYTPVLEQTLTNVLSSQDISFTKEAEGKYKLQAYQYHLKTPSEGLAQLKSIAAGYNNKASWEKRKDSLLSCMIATLGLDKLPQKAAGKPIMTKNRTHDGYTVQDFALETLPGVFINGSIYMPLHTKGKIPVVFHPDGHFQRGRYRDDCQYRAASLARMGVMSVSYDLFGWEGESVLQVDAASHRKSLVNTLQIYNTQRLMDHVLSMPMVDANRVGITGASGGGSQTMLTAAIDPRITISIPVVMMSSYHSGGCPCESGMGIHLCGGGTNNVEIAAMAAPRPQLVISDGKDWTKDVPELEFPFLKRVYDFYPGAMVQNHHLAMEGHDYGPSKRQAMYAFVAKHFDLNTDALKDKEGKIMEQAVVIEKDEVMKAFGADGKQIPVHALIGWQRIEAMIKSYLSK